MYDKPLQFSQVRKSYAPKTHMRRISLNDMQVGKE